jgi:hypothetical protein
MAYVVVDGKDVEPGYGGVFKQIRRRLGVLAFGITRSTCRRARPGASTITPSPDRRRSTSS